MAQTNFGEAATITETSSGAYRIEHANGEWVEIDENGIAASSKAGTWPPDAHATDHEDGGVDELSVEGLSGDLADPQDPKGHAHDGDAITPQSVNAVRWARDGDDLQAILDGLPTGDQNNRNLVMCDPAAAFDAISIPAYTIVSLNGARIMPSSDVDAVVASNPGTWLRGPGLIVTAHLDYTSRAYVVDTSGFTNNANNRFRNSVRITGPVMMWGGNDKGTGVHLIADGNALGQGCLFELSIAGYHDQIVTQVDNGGFVSSTEFHIHLGPQAGGTQIKNTTTAGTPGGGQALYRGSIQCSDGTTHTIHNEVAGELGPQFEGQMWDPSNPSTAAVAGDYVRVDTPTDVNANHVNFGVGTVVNGMGQAALAGGTPTEADYAAGDIVEDTDNPGTLHLLTAGNAWVTI